jgi:hypothetical protein
MKLTITIIMEKGDCSEISHVISKPIFDEWYAKVAFELTEDERLGFTHIYYRIDSHNKFIAELYERNRAALSSKTNKDSRWNDLEINHYMMILSAAYHNLRLIDMMVRPLLALREKYKIRSDGDLPQSVIQEIDEEFRNLQLEGINRGSGL